VTNTAGGWVWSSSLLFFVVPACLWLHLEGTRVGVSRTHQLAFLVVGFFGAISASFPIAFATVHAYRRDGTFLDHLRCRNFSVVKKQPAATAPSTRWLVVPAIAAMISATMLPYTVKTANGIYIASLAVLHVVLILPALLSQSPVVGRVPAKSDLAVIWHSKTALIFACVAGAAALQHLHNLCQYMWPQAVSHSNRAVEGSLLEAGWANACQASISYDAVFSASACLLYMAANGDWHTSVTRQGSSTLLPAWPFVLSAPFVSPAAAFAAYLACEASQKAFEGAIFTRRKAEL